MTNVKLLLFLMPLWLFLAPEASYGRYAAIMIDADNGNVLHEVEANHPWYPASLTKVMTLYMAFDALSSGQLHLFDNMTTSYHASRQPNSKLGLRAGEQITVEDAILAIITRSANDAAVVLAEHLGGTEEHFAFKMTEKASSLGMRNTRFLNATGLPDSRQVTTSRDMAMLAWKIQRHFPEYYPYFSSHSFFYKGRELRGINKFTARYPGAEGMKTGYTCGSGFNLMGAAHQNGRHLIGVVLGGMTSNERYRLMTDMMDTGFNSLYSPGNGRHIDTVLSGYGGEPPYQLDCGKGSKHHAVAAKQRTAHRSTSKNRKRLAKRSSGKKHLAAGKTSKKTASKVAARSKSTGKRKKVASVKSSSKSKRAASKKSRVASVKKSSHTAKSKKVARSSAKGKSVASTKSEKSKNYHHPS
ncbi:MAG: serine hydrolase [Gammaproteobacteria bacterium]